MKKENLVKSSFLWKMAFIVSMLLFSTTFSNAQACQTQTFGQFQQAPASNAFTFNRNNFTTNGVATFTGTSQATFRFSNILGAPSGDIPARVTINASTSAPAQNTGGNRTIQPITGNFTITITRASDNANLLTAVVVNTPNTSDIAGNTGTNIGSAEYSASTSAQQITFTSDFLNFSQTTDKNLALAFSGIAVRFFADQPGFLPVETFTTAATGTFAACPLPRFVGTTAASAEISGRVLTPSGGGLAKAKVVLTNANGENITVTTNSFGYYRFEVESGQSVVISVASKRYRYSPKVLNVGEDLYESDFVPE